MPLFSINGWGGYGHRLHLETTGNAGLRVEGWGGGVQWRAHCVTAGDRVSGSTGGPQWKLKCEPVPPPPP